MPVRWEDIRKVPQRTLKQGDIVLEISGGTSDRPTGRTVFISQRLLDRIGQPTIPASFCRLVRVNPQRADPYFVYWWLQDMYASGRTWGYQNRSTGIANFQFEHFLDAEQLALPPVPEQRAIAETLGALTDKIESNKQLLVCIVALADALYSAACGEAPRETGIGNIAEFHNRRRVPLSSRDRNERPGPYPYYGATGVFGYVDDFLFDEVMALVGEDGSVVNDDGTPVTQYIWGKSWINNHAHALTGRGISTELLFVALRTADVRPIVTGAVQPKISMGNLKSLQVEIPQGDALVEVEADLQPLFSLYRQVSGELRVLVDLRDTLRPELLSGRIRVPEAEEAVAGVGA